MNKGKWKTYKARLLQHHQTTEVCNNLRKLIQFPLVDEKRVKTRSDAWRLHESRMNTGTEVAVEEAKLTVKKHATQVIQVIYVHQFFPLTTESKSQQQIELQLSDFQLA